jgi:hypothetical protein
VKRVHKKKPCINCGAPTTKTWCKPCGYKNRKLVPWNKGTIGICKSNSGSFQKGHIPVFTGKDLNVEARKKISAANKGKHYSAVTEFNSSDVIGSKNNKWRGDEVGYFSLHSWLTREYGKPMVCENCGGKKNVQWASKNYLYTRQREDWLHLCYRCHRTYDLDNGWGLASSLFNLKTGERHV